MSFKEWIVKVADDISTLEVATLTNETDFLNLSPELPDPEKKVLAEARKQVTDARTKLLAAIQKKETAAFKKEDKKKAIKDAKEVLREAENQERDVKKALGLYDPKDIFSKIRAALPKADLVAYSRFEIEGDSTNYINNKESVKDLIERHKDMVKASQESRKALFESALNAIKG